MAHISSRDSDGASDLLELKADEGVEEVLAGVTAVADMGNLLLT